MNRKWAVPLLLLSGVLPLILLLSSEARLTGRLGGVPLDDSWIHYQYADNLRSGFGFSFNPGEPTPGSTSPLWVLLLSAIGFGYVVPAKLLGMLAFLACGLLVFWILEDAGVNPWISLVCGMGTYWVGRFAWAAPSGMETTSFALLSLVGVKLWAKDTQGRLRWVTALVFALACLMRPEGYLLLLLAAATWAVLRIGNLPWVELVRNVVGFFLLAGLLIAPYLIFSYLTTGQAFTSTFYVKSSTWNCEPGLAYFGWISGAFFIDQPVAFVFGFISALTLLVQAKWKEQPIQLLAVLWWLLLPAAYGFLAPCISSYYLRYTTPVLPIMMIGGGFGSQSIGRWLGNRKRPGNVVLKPTREFGLPASLLAEGSLVSLLVFIVFWMPYYGYAVSDIRTMHVKLGEWLAINTSQDAVLAVNDVGAIGFFADRKIIDLGGLVTPAVVPLILDKQPGEWDDSLAEYLKQQRPDYLVIFPEWYPKFESLLPLQELITVQLAERKIAGMQGVTVVAGGGRMVVYRLDW